MIVFMVLILPAALLLYAMYLIFKAFIILLVALIKVVFSHKEEIQLGRLDPHSDKVIW